MLSYSVINIIACCALVLSSSIKSVNITQQADAGNQTLTQREFLHDKLKSIAGAQTSYQRSVFWRAVHPLSVSAVAWKKMRFGEGKEKRWGGGEEWWIGQTEVREEEDRRLYGCDLSEGELNCFLPPEGSKVRVWPLGKWSRTVSSWIIMAAYDWVYVCVVFPYALISVFARDCMSVCPVSCWWMKSTFLWSSEVKFFHWKHLDIQTSFRHSWERRAEQSSRLAHTTQLNNVLDMSKSRPVCPFRASPPHAGWDYRGRRCSNHCVVRQNNSQGTLKGMRFQRCDQDNDKAGNSDGKSGKQKQSH